MKHKTQKQLKPNNVRACCYDFAYLTVTAVLLIFPFILQTVINLIMPSIGGQGGEGQREHTSGR